MANLYGRLKDEHKSGTREVTRTSSDLLSATLETWEGGLRMEMWRNGDFKVSMGDKFGERSHSFHTIFEGNINDKTFTLPDQVYNNLLIQGVHE